MADKMRTNAGQGLGIAGLVLGIISVPLAVMGCTFAVALLFGAVGIILSAIGLSQARRENGAKGITTAGLVVSIVGSVIAVLWFVFLGAFFQDAVREKGGWLEQLEQLEEVGKDLDKEMEGIEQDIDEEDMEDLEEKMEQLEGEAGEQTQGVAKDTGEADIEEAEKQLEELRKEKDKK